jgi:hypothetical protein
MASLYPAAIWHNISWMAAKAGLCNGTSGDIFEWLVIGTTFALIMMAIEIAVFSFIGYIDVFVIEKTFGFSKQTELTWLAGRVRALIFFSLMYLPFILITVAVTKFLQDFLIMGFILGTVICKTIILHLFPKITAALDQTEVKFEEDQLDIKERIIHLA